MLPLLLLFPFVMSLPAAWLGANHRRQTAWLTLAPALLTLAFAQLLQRVVVDGPFTVETAWAPSLGLSFAFQVDGLSALFAVLISGIGALVVLYASAYMAEHPCLGRFHATLFAFMGAMLGTVLSDNVFVLFMFWELTGFTSFLLIGLDAERPAARAAALQALLVTGAGGLALLGAGALLAQVAGTPRLSGMSAAILAPGDPRIVAATALVMLAAFTKSAQVPFHFWLPNAMAAPTPVSAYLHSATMVKAGVYLLARTLPLLAATAIWTPVLVTIGAITFVGGAWRSVQETDLKRVLAYATVSALGALVLLLGIGTHDAIVAALTYLVAHACYKGALFMVAGAVDHEAGTRDITALSGLRRAMPRIGAAGTIAAASMLGLPLFFGFLAKELVYDAVMHAPLWRAVLTVVAVAASALLGTAALLAGWLPFAGPARREGHAHDPSWKMWLGPVTLATLGVLFGIAPALSNATIAAAASAVAGVPIDVTTSLWHGLTPVLLLSIVTVVLAGALYVARTPLRLRAWPRSLATERLYSGALAGLDGLSRLVAPAMYSASLRSYVLVVLLTVGALLGLALTIGGGGWTITHWTPIQPHEFVLIATICIAAIVAARADNSMTAVISLGVVGYGLALIFVFFGAPDLAMTQFSVETLTVVIFVLVFRRFGSMDSLTSGWIRARDIAIASTLGGLLGTLTLLVASSGSRSRVAAFFAEAGPTLAHGRNIVNVILVDFRALDTLGEITVLVTAAIGVHALLRLGAEKAGPPR